MFPKGGSAVNWTLRQEIEDSARRKMEMRESDAAGWGAVRLVSEEDAAALLRSLAPGSSQGSGAGVLLEVFAPWCPTCSKIKPLLGAAAEELQQVGGRVSWHPNPNDSCVCQAGVSVVAVDGSSSARGPGDDESDASSELRMALQFTKMTGYPGLYLFRREADGGLISSSYDGGWCDLTQPALRVHHGTH